MRVRFGFVLVIFTVVIAALGWIVLSLTLPSFDIRVFLSIPIFLALLEGGVILCLNKYLKGVGHAKDRFLFLVKGVKVLLSIAFLLVGLYVMNQGKVFVSTVLLYYILFIVFESWMFIKCNKEIERKAFEKE